MDALDLKILRHMGTAPWASPLPATENLRPSVLARHLEVSPETVKDRIAKLEAAGVIEGYRAYPNLRHLGLSYSVHALRVQGARKARAFEQAQLVDGVIEVMDLQGPLLVVGLAYATSTERERRLRLLSDLTGDATPVHTFDARLPPVERPLTHLDWRILFELHRDARRPHGALAEELGVSYRTVKRRVDRMVTASSLSIIPVVEVSRIRGVIPFQLAATVGPKSDASASRVLAERFLDRLLQPFPHTEGPSRLVGGSFFAETLDEVERMRAQAAEVLGTADVLVLLVARSRETGWLEERIGREVAATAPA